MRRPRGPPSGIAGASVVFSIHSGRNFSVIRRPSRDPLPLKRHRSHHFPTGKRCGSVPPCRNHQSVSRIPGIVSPDCSGGAGPDVPARTAGTVDVRSAHGRLSYRTIGEERRRRGGRFGALVYIEGTGARILHMRSEETNEEIRHKVVFSRSRIDVVTGISRTAERGRNVERGSRVGGRRG